MWNNLVLSIMVNVESFSAEYNG